jgi:hypothetical protein
MSLRSKAEANPPSVHGLCACTRRSISNPVHAHSRHHMYKWYRTGARQLVRGNVAVLWGRCMQHAGCEPAVASDAEHFEASVRILSNRDLRSPAPEGVQPLHGCLRRVAEISVLLDLPEHGPMCHDAKGAGWGDRAFTRCGSGVRPL